MNVFISYSTRDGQVSQGLLSALARSIEKVGTPYVDLLHNHGLHPQETVIRALRASNGLLIIDTPAAKESPWVRRELLLARHLGTPEVWFNPHSQDETLASSLVRLTDQIAVVVRNAHQHRGSERTEGRLGIPPMGAAARLEVDDSESSPKVGVGDVARADLGK